MAIPNWSLTIDNFGPVARAEIKLAPLVLLVGKNNTGKSYVASLLWQLLNPWEFIRPVSARGRKWHRSCLQMANALGRGEKTQIERHDWEALTAWINETLDKDKAKIAGGLFAHDSCLYEAATFEPSNLPGSLRVELQERPSRKSIRSKRPPFRGAAIRRSEKSLAILLDEGHKFSEDDALLLLLHLARTLLVGEHRGDALYIPAARTGLMLAFKPLVAGLIGNLGGEKNDTARTTLPSPVVDFLQGVNFCRDFEDEHQDNFKIATDIEEKILNGKIDQNEDEEIGYTLMGSGVRLPLHTVSSLVTELAPLIILLKAGLNNNCIIFEEPEAHLHLEAQRILARQLIRLVNSGVQLIITTHSDTFLQQINILMQLHNHPKRGMLIDEFSYENDATINPDNAVGYLFEQRNGRTFVRAMTKTQSGFVEPVMNETISALTREVIRMDETEVAYSDA